MILKLYIKLFVSKVIVSLWYMIKLRSEVNFVIFLCMRWFSILIMYDVVRIFVLKWWSLLKFSWWIYIYNNLVLVESMYLELLFLVFYIYFVYLVVGWNILFLLLNFILLIDFSKFYGIVYWGFIKRDFCVRMFIMRKKWRGRYWFRLFWF